MRHNLSFALLVGTALASPLSGQARTDSLRRSGEDSVVQRLDAIRVGADRVRGSIYTAPRLTAGLITTGAKSEVVDVAGLSANLAEKTGRQIFAEIPGIFVYDMDGSGNQVNISARGLDPHRSWEFNVRQNGVSVVSDEYAYPASHYSPPMEAVERIELIRGTASLQYGSQFGGLLNYVIKSPDTTRMASVESRSTVGSSGLAGIWNAVGGKVGGVSYYGYGAFRRSSGFRDNAGSTYDAEYLSAEASLSATVLWRAEIGRSRYLYQQPGPLNDGMFAVGARSATRSRNWYSPDITVPAISLTWTPSTNTRATLVTSGVFGTRSSVAVGGFATTSDVPSATGVWSTRQVDVDRYVTRTVELRAQHNTRVASLLVGVSGGIAIADNDTRRRQQGVGSRGSDYALTLEPGGDFRRDLHYRTRNVAVHAESEVHVTPRWTLVPGVRAEIGATHLTGRLAYYDAADTPRDISHRYPLFGLRSSMAMGTGAEWYAGFSQAYRPMILKDVLPETATERTDAHLRDARGWTTETGVRGSAGRSSYDIGAFVMRYANRFGMLTVSEAGGAPLTYKTNVGATRTRGLEGRLSALLGATRGVSWRAFTSASLMDASYTKGSVISVGRNIDVSGNDLESVPHVIARGGVTAQGNRAILTLNVSHVSRTFADALNSITPNVTGAVGLVPAYTVIDLNGSWTLSSHWRLSAGLNNLFDRRYFTKRPQFYPGPGIWPSDGRTVQLSLHIMPMAGRD